MTIELNIQNRSKIYNAANCCEGEIRLESQRTGGASKLSFSLVKDDVMAFVEGNTVTYTIDGVPMFFGYIFSKERTEEQVIRVVAYDQLIYLVKNKDTYVFEDKKTSDIVSMIAGDYLLKTGTIDNSEYIIPSLVEDGQTLLDIIYNAISETLLYTGKMFCLYDNFGKLELKEMNRLRSRFIIADNDGMTGYSYKSGIDTETYNAVKIIWDNEDAGRREIYTARDDANINAWGVLQYFETVDSKSDPGKIREKMLQILELHNKVSKTLTIDFAGIPELRAGNSVLVKIDGLGEMNLKNWLVIEKCVHTVKENEHFMKLTLRGDF